MTEPSQMHDGGPPQRFSFKETLRGIWRIIVGIFTGHPPEER